MYWGEFLEKSVHSQSLVLPRDCRTSLYRISISFILAVRLPLSSQPQVISKCEIYEHSVIGCCFAPFLLHIMLQIKHCSYSDHYCKMCSLKHKWMGASNGFCHNANTSRFQAYLKGDWLPWPGLGYGPLCGAGSFHSHDSNFCCCVLLSLAELSKILWKTQGRGLFKL